LTIMRLGPDQFRVVTGAAHGMADKKWFADHLPADGSAQIVDLSSALSTIGVWGPKSRTLLAAITPDDMSNAGFKYGTCRRIELDDLTVVASRISYAGELGWELYVPMDQGGRAWDILFAAGAGLGVVAVGNGVYGTTARVEKGYRSYGNELTPEYDLMETGLERKIVKREHFVGKQAHLRQRAVPPAAILCTLGIDFSGVDPSGRRFPLGHEAILSPEGEPIEDRKGRRSYVTTASAGPSVGTYLLLAYLPPELANVGEILQVEVMDQRYPVSVLVAGNGAVFDPGNERLKG
jgi:heterotetrameric sarcosine oxidase gamma subunit